MEFKTFACQYVCRQGQSSFELRPDARLLDVEWDMDVGYCLDAPQILPMGSMRGAAYWIGRQTPVQRIQLRP